MERIIETSNMEFTKDAPVVRCFDCKHLSYTIAFRNKGEYSDAEQVPFCDKLRRETEPYNFCAWAERDE